MLDILGRLVDRSLVHVAGGPGDTRYRLLETVRRYAADKLREAGERDRAFEAHATFFLALAAERQADQVAWLDRMELEHDDLRAALRWLLAVAPEHGGRLAACCGRSGTAAGYYAEARVWLEQAAALADRMTPAVRVGVLTGAGGSRSCSATTRGDAAPGAALALTTSSATGGAAAVPSSASARSPASRRATPTPASLHESSLAVWRELVDPAGIAGRRTTSLRGLAAGRAASAPRQLARRRWPRCGPGAAPSGRPPARW